MWYQIELVGGGLVDHPSLLPSLIITLMDTQVMAGQYMILVAKVRPITRKESATLADKSIFAKIQTFTFSILFYLTLDITCTSNQDIDIVI